MVQRLKAENRLTPEDEFFRDLPPPTPRKHFIENIPTRLPEAAGPRRQGPRPGPGCARFSGSARAGDKEPQIPGRGEAGRPESSRAPDPRGERTSTSGLASGTGGPEPSASACVRGRLGAHSQGGPSPGPLHPEAVLQRELVCKINAPAWFHPHTGETPISQGQRSIMGSRIPPTFSEDIHCVLGNLGLGRTPRPEGVAQKGRSAVCPAVRCAFASAWMHI